MGPLKRYSVAGMDDGSGRPYPADTLVELNYADAVKLGLEKARPAPKSDDTANTEAKPDAKPAGPTGTRKRQAPKK